MQCFGKIWQLSVFYIFKPPITGFPKQCFQLDLDIFGAYLNMFLNNPNLDPLKVPYLQLVQDHYH